MGLTTTVIFLCALAIPLLVGAQGSWEKKQWWKKGSKNVWEGDQSERSARARTSPFSDRDDDVVSHSTSSGRLPGNGFFVSGARANSEAGCGPNGCGAVAGASAEADLARFHHQWGGNGPARASGTARIGANADASAGASFDPRGRIGVGAKADAFAGAEIDGEGELHEGIFDGEAEGSAKAGAEASGSVGAEEDWRHGTLDAGAEGEAFAGAKANGNVGVDVGGVGADAEGSVGAGIGVDAKADVGCKKGKCELDVGLGAYLGVGAGGDVKVDVDVGKIGKEAEHEEKAVAHGTKTALHSVDRWARSARNIARSRVKGLEKSRIGKLTKRGFSALRRRGSKALSTLEHGERSIENKERGFLSSLKKRGGRLISGVRNKARSFLSKARRNPGLVLKSGERKLENGGRRILKGIGGFFGRITRRRSTKKTRRPGRRRRKKLRKARAKRRVRRIRRRRVSRVRRRVRRTRKRVRRVTRRRTRVRRRRK